MIAQRIPSILTIAALVVLVAAYSFLLLQSTDLAMGLFIVGLTILLLMVNPFFGLVVYLLFSYTGPQVYVPALANLRVMLVIGVATLGSMLARRVILADRKGESGGPQVFLMAWFFIAVVVSRLAHLEFGRALTAGYDLVNVLVLFVLILKLVTTERRLHQVLTVVFIGTVALAVQGVLQSVVGGGIFEGQEFEESRIAGIGQFVNPNMLAIGLVCGIPIAFALFKRAPNLLLKILIVSGLVIVMYALYLTNSRGGVLSLCVIAGVAFARRYGVVAGLVMAAISFVAVIQFGPSRMSTLSATEASAYGRLLAWNEGYKILAANPLFGAGAGAWYEKYRTLVAHNSFIHCAAELGLFGLSAWVLLAFISVKNLWYVSGRREATNPHIPTYATAVLLAFLAFLFASLFISKTYHMLLFLLLGLSGAVVNLFINESKVEYSLMTRRDVILGLTLMVAGLITFKAFLLLKGISG